MGKLFFRIKADAKSGIVDMFAGPTEEQMAVFPTRIVPVPGGGSAYIFTFFRTPSMTDDQFDQQFDSLRREFSNLERIFASQIQRCDR